MKNSKLKYGTSFILSPPSKCVITTSLLDWGFWLHTLRPASLSWGKAVWDLNACRPPLQALHVNKKASWTCWLTSAPLQSFLNFVSQCIFGQDLLPLCPPQTSAPKRHLVVVAIGGTCEKFTVLRWGAQHSFCWYIRPHPIAHRCNTEVVTKTVIPIHHILQNYSDEQLWKRYYVDIVVVKIVVAGKWRRNWWQDNDTEKIGKFVVLLTPMLTPSPTTGEGPTADCHTRLPCLAS